MKFALVFGLVGLSAGNLEYGRRFTGDGTYYGGGSNGHCSISAPLPAMYQGMLNVAINHSQYAHSTSCGACVRMRGTGRWSGSNPFTTEWTNAYVNNECPECRRGDLDIGTSGDGRGGIEWEFIPCPSDSFSEVQFQGSNPNYLKMQPRGMATPPVTCSINGQQGTRTVDNFFTFHGAGYGGCFNVEVTSEDRKRYSGKVCMQSSGVVRVQGAQTVGGQVPALSETVSDDADEQGWEPPAPQQNPMSQQPAASQQTTATRPYPPRSGSYNSAHYPDHRQSRGKSSGQQSLQAPQSQTYTYSQGNWPDWVKKALARFGWH